MILVKFEDNYADEFDTSGFQIMTQYELDEFLAFARDSFIRASAMELTPERFVYHRQPELVFNDDYVECYFGTNEQWMWTSYEDFMSCLSFSQLSSEAMKYIVTNVGTDYGMFPSGMGEY